MADNKNLFDYNEDSIKSLDWKEHIRLRPGMYIGKLGDGSSPDDGIYVMLKEVIDNSIDEAVAGYCSEVKITLSADQRAITVEDNGRGIPIAIHPDTKKSTLETIFTFLHSGGKFENKVYKTSGGLHGVGVTAVNALSANLKA